MIPERERADGKVSTEDTASGFLRTFALDETGQVIGQVDAGPIDHAQRAAARHRGDAGLLEVLHATTDSVVRELLGSQRSLRGGQLGNGDSAW